MNEKNNVIQYDASIIKRALQAQDNPWRETDEYSIGPDGIFVRTIKIYKNGVEDARWTQIHPFPLMPVECIDMYDSETLKSVFDDENQVSSNDTKTHIKVKFLDIYGQERVVKIPQSELSQINKQSLLAKRWPLPPANKMSKVADIMLKVLADGRNAVKSPAGVEYEPCIKITAGSERCGWSDEDHIRPGHAKYVGDEDCMTFKAGKAEIQIDVMSKWIINDLQFALMAAYQLAGYTFGSVYTANVNFIMELTGDPGGGKSERLIALSSVEGIPVKGQNRTYFDSNVSIPGIERYLPCINNGTGLIDEFDKIVSNMKSDAAAQLILLIANGAQRLLAENKTSKARKIKTWNIAAIVVSNKSILERIRGHDDFAAIKDRFMVINTSDEEITGLQGDLAVVNVWKRLLQENYGHVYGLVVDYIRENRLQLIKRFNTLTTELATKEYKHHFEKDMRDSEMIAFLQLGADLVSEIYGKEAGIASHKAVEFYKRRVADTTVMAEHNHKMTIVRFKEWIADNIGSMRISGFSYTVAHGRDPEEVQLEHAARLTNNATMSHRGAIAGLEQSRPMSHPTDFDGCIWLKPEAEASLEKSGISIDEVMAAAKALDMLPKTKKGEIIEKNRLSDFRKEWLQNKKSHATRIFLFPFPEEEEEQENEEEVFSYSNMTQDDIENLVKENLIHAAMYDVPKI